MQLSIIIPYYNEEWEVIEPNLNMLNSQLFCNFNEVEVLISQDSEQLQFPISYLEKFQNLNITVLNIKHNQGPGLARQQALDICHGEYVMFLDADDSFENLIVLWEFQTEMYKHHKDVYYTEWYEVQSNNTSVIYKRESKMPFLHGIVFRTKFLRDNNIRFHPELKVHEDLYFNRLVYYYIEENNMLQYDFPTIIWKPNMQSITRRNDYAYYYKGEPEYIRAIDLSLDKDVELHSKITFPIFNQVKYFYERYTDKKFISQCPKETLTLIYDMLSYFCNKWNTQLGITPESGYYDWYNQLLELNIHTLPKYQSYIKL